MLSQIFPEKKRLSDLVLLWNRFIQKMDIFTRTKGHKDLRNNWNKTNNSEAVGFDENLGLMKLS